MASQYEIIEKIDNICTNILQSTRSRLYINMRYLSMAFDGLKYAMSNDTATVGTDGFYLYYSPAFLMECYRQKPSWIGRAYVHIIFHCIFKHLVNMEERDERLWNLSCDIAVEMLIDSLQVRVLKQNMSSARRVTYKTINEKLKVATAEGIYNLLFKGEIASEKLEAEFYMDDHSFWKQYQNVKQPQELSNPNDDQNDGDNGDENGDGNGGRSGNQGENKPKKDSEEFNDKWQQISQKTETDTETFSKNQSDENSQLSEFLRVENRQRYDYRDFLKKFTVSREVMQMDMDSYDYIYYTYGLRTYGNMPLIENLEYSEIKRVEEFVIVIDTSASCETDLVRIFLEETYSVLKDNESFFRKINIHIIQCDNHVQEDKIIVSKEDFEQYMNSFEIKGRGGTDFSVAFDYVNNLCDEKKIRELKGLIYFTDGYGKYPSQMPSYEAAFVFVNDSFDDAGVPPWAIEIVLNREEIYELGGRGF